MMWLGGGLSHAGQFMLGVTSPNKRGGNPRNLELIPNPVPHDAGMIEQQDLLAPLLSSTCGKTSSLESSPKKAGVRLSNRWSQY